MLGGGHDGERNFVGRSHAENFKVSGRLWKDKGEKRKQWRLFSS